MKTLVTGANGFLGANLVRELLVRGESVRALVRKGTDIQNLQGLDAELFFGDLLDEGSMLKAARGCTRVIHAAGKMPDYCSDFEEYSRINVAGTRNVVQAAEKAGVQRIVHVSSCCVFGGGSREDPGTELSEFTGFRFNSGYINSKYLAQQWVLGEVERKGLPIVIVNPTMMLGPFGAAAGSGEIILRILKQRYQLCPASGKNFIDVRDAAEAACNALTRGTPGESYLLASENLEFSELFDRVNRISGRQCRQYPVPATVLKCAGMIGNALRKITGKDLPLSYSYARQLASVSYFSGAKAMRELGLPQRSVDEAIRDAIGWFMLSGVIGDELKDSPAIAVAA